MQSKIQSAPTMLYPESDGKPMAETDTHRNLLMDCIQTLQHHFRDANDVYVSGNLLVYYKDGEKIRSVAPDVFVVPGVANKKRRVYVVHEEHNTPDFVLEIASRGTYSHDLGRKKEIYASFLSVKEYYIYVPYGVVPAPFIGFRLVDGTYEEIDFVNDRLKSDVLGLELGVHEETLHFYNPQTKQWLQPAQARAESEKKRAETQKARAESEKARAESEKARAESEKARAESEKKRAETQKARAESAEAKLAEALAEIQRLQAKNQ